MKKYSVLILALLSLNSCSKIEEIIDEAVNKTSQTIKDEAKNKVNETLNNSINSLTNAENAQFEEVFSKGDSIMISEFAGKKISLPNSTMVYVFKYKADKDLLIPFLEQQETTNEEKSDKIARKIDGQSFIDKLNFIEKFLPENTIDLSFLEELKNDKTIEYFKLKRFPNNSTIIYNPKTQQVFQLVEVAQ